MPDFDKQDPTKTYIGGQGRGWRNAPTDRPTTRASDSAGCKARYGPTGKKS